MKLFSGALALLLFAYNKIDTQTDDNIDNWINLTHLFSKMRTPYVFIDYRIHWDNCTHEFDSSFKREHFLFPIIFSKSPNHDFRT